MNVDLLSVVHGLVGNIMSICAISAVLNLFVNDDGAGFGFRMACSLGVSLMIIRGMMGIF